LLTELHHYSDLQHGYPGDPARGLPAFTAADPPFTHTYVVQLGEDLDQDHFTAAADMLAKYLYSDAITPAGTFFDQCRTPPAGGPPAGGAPTVRTFGLAQLGLSYDDVPAAAVDELCRALVTHWRINDLPKSEEAPADLSDPTALLADHFTSDLPQQQQRAEVAARMDAMGLTARAMVEQLRTVVTRELGNDPDSYLLTVLQEIVFNAESAP
jgi:hypothetical protein